MISMARVASSQRVVVENPNLVCLYLRDDLQAVQQKQGEIILNLNRFGSWVPGLEIVGGFVPFSIEKAVRPFDPVIPEPHVPAPGTVTYDPEADAAFISLLYAPSFYSLTITEQDELRKVSHSINPAGIYGLDAGGGLVWVKIPVADVTGSMDQFLQLLRR